jgi:hypothetical protein
MNPPLINPFADPATVTGYEVWYETIGRRAEWVDPGGATAAVAPASTWQSERRGRSL